MTYLNRTLTALGLALATTAAQAEQKSAFVAGGCFWCVESDFESVAGVVEVVSGYTGGTVDNPTYKQVVRGGTGHLEAVEIIFDDSQVSYSQLINLFFRSIDPTDAGGQFCDRGASYATAIFVSNPEEMATAEAEKAAAEAELGMSIVTPIREASTFYPAKDYHQDYYKQEELVLTRRGPKSKASAYKFYRQACKRDERIKQLWGDSAPFANHSS